MVKIKHQCQRTQELGSSLIPYYDYHFYHTSEINIISLSWLEKVTFVSGLLARLSRFVNRHMLAHALRYCYLFLMSLLATFSVFFIASLNYGKSKVGYLYTFPDGNLA
jgi:uncharacterized membrane protein